MNEGMFFLFPNLVFLSNVTGLFVATGHFAFLWTIEYSLATSKSIFLVMSSFFSFGSLSSEAIFPV